MVVGILLIVGVTLPGIPVFVVLIILCVVVHDHLSFPVSCACFESGMRMQVLFDLCNLLRLSPKLFSSVFYFHFTHDFLQQYE